MSEKMIDQNSSYKRLTKTFENKADAKPLGVGNGTSERKWERACELINIVF